MDIDWKKFFKGALNKPEEGDKIEYFNLLSRVSGYILTRSEKDLVGASCFYEIDVTKFWEEFQAYKKELDYHLSFNVLMMRMMIEGLKAAPRLNSHMNYNYTTSCGHLIIKKHMDIAMPTVLENGETFPIKVRNAEEKTLKELQNQVDTLLETLKTTNLDRVLFDNIAQRTVGFMLKGKFISTIAQTVTGYVGPNKVATLKGLFDRAPRDGSSLLMEDVNEGTVCFTNWGSLGKGIERLMVGWTPLLYPQVFLFGIGALQDRNYVHKNENGEIEVTTKKILPVNFVFDHRIGALNDIVPFMKAMDKVFEKPEIIREW